MSAIDTMSSGRMLSKDLIWSRFGKFFRLIQAHYLSGRDLRRTRLHLFELTDAELIDIGLTRELAEREASRSLLACYLNNSR